MRHKIICLLFCYLRQRRRYMFLPVFVCLSVSKITKKRVHRFGWTVIPLHWQIFIGHRPKKYRTSHENIGFIGHMYVSVLNLYTSAFLLCMYVCFCCRDSVSLARFRHSCSSCSLALASFWGDDRYSVQAACASCNRRIKSRVTGIFSTSCY